MKPEHNDDTADSLLYRGKPVEHVKKSTIIPIPGGKGKKEKYLILVPDESNPERPHTYIIEEPIGRKWVRKWSRRSFLTVSLGTLGYAYYKVAMGPIASLGKTIDYGIYRVANAKEITENILNKIIARSSLEDKLRDMEEQGVIAQNIITKFKDAYGEQHDFLNTIRNIDTELASLNQDMNDAARNLPTQQIDNTYLGKGAKSVYEGFQKLLGRKKIGTQEYAQGFRSLVEKQQDIADKIRFLEKEMTKAYERMDHKTMEKSMKQYISHHQAHKTLRQIVAEKATGEIYKIDEELKAELGHDYIKHYENIRKNINIEKALPMAGLAAVIGLAAIPLYKISGYIGKMAEYVADKEGRMSRRKFLKIVSGREEENDKQNTYK